MYASMYVCTSQRKGTHETRVQVVLGLITHWQQGKTLKRQGGGGIVNKLKLSLDLQNRQILISDQNLGTKTQGGPQPTKIGVR